MNEKLEIGLQEERFQGKDTFSNIFITIKRIKTNLKKYASVRVDIIAV